MARSRRTGASRPSGSSTASKASSSKTPATTTAKPSTTTSTAKPATTTPATTTPKNPTTTSAQAPPATTGGIGSGIGNFVSNMAAATAGSVIGHTIAHSIFGGSSQTNNEVEKAPEQNAVAPAEEIPTEKNANNPCFTEYQAYSKCIQSNQDTYKCQWAIDLLKECRIQSSQNGFRV